MSKSNPFYNSTTGSSTIPNLKVKNLIVTGSATGPFGSGTVIGPVSSIVDDIATWNSTDGAVLKNSGIKAGTGSGSNSIYLGTNDTPNTNANTVTGRLSTSASLGGANTFTGYNIAPSSSTSFSTSVGANTMTGATSASYFTTLGYGAGATLQTGNNNTFVGANSNTDDTASTNRMALGYGAIATENNQIMLGDANVTSVVPKSTALVELGTVDNPWKLFQLKPWTLSIIPPATNHLGAMAVVNDTIGGNPITMPLFSDGNDWLSMTGGATLWPSFTIVASGTNLYWSNNGASHYSSSASIFSSEAYAFCYTDINDSIVYLLGGYGTNNLGYSLNGKTWFGLGANVFGVGGGCLGIACSPEGVYVLVGFGGQEIYSSTIAGNYTSYTARGAPFSGAGFAVGHNGKLIGDGGLFVACGTGAKSMLYSTDGTTWTEVPGSYAKSTSFTSVSYGNTVWMMGGDSSGTDSIVTTSNPIAGLTSRGKTDFTSECRGLCYNPDLQRWVGVGAGGLFYAYSDDVGDTWTTGTGVTITTGHSVIWNGYCFVLQAQGTTRCAYSVAGIVWTDIPTVASSVQGVVGSKKMLPWI